MDLIDPKIFQQSKKLYALTEQMRADGQTIYPPSDKVFRALKETPPERVRAVILGQDPYVREGQAEGLCFSVQAGTAAPPSLQNIFREYCDDLRLPCPTSPSLVSWAREGVLLLNTALTVEAGKTNSHKDLGWQEVTHEILRKASGLPQPIVFICWGANARNAIADIPIKDNKCALFAPHPSPLSAHRGFFGSKPFSKTNAWLEQHGSAPINWRLP